MKMPKISMNGLGNFVSSNESSVGLIQLKSNFKSNEVSKIASNLNGSTHLRSMNINGSNQTVPHNRKPSKLNNYTSNNPYELKVQEMDNEF